MAITSWTSEGMVWDTLENKLLYPHIEAIRLALVERVTASGYAGSGGGGLPAILSTPIASGTLLPYSNFTTMFGQVIESWITGLIPQFINHTDNGGNWHDQHYTYTTSWGVPKWSVTSLMAAIGESRILLGTNKLPSKEWALQQYKILNLLVWTSLSGTSTGSNLGGYSRTSGLQADFATAVAAFNAASWTSGGSYYQHLVYGDEYSSNRTIIRQYYNWRFSGWTTAYKHAMDVYAGVSPSDINQFRHFYHNDNDYGTTDPGNGSWQYAMSKVEEIVTPFNDSTLDLEIGKIDYSTVDDFLPTEIYDSKGILTWSGPVGGAYPYFVINKWNVVDGFQFQ